MPSELTPHETTRAATKSASGSSGAHDAETHERHAQASASGGLNLNLFGALSGALSSKSRKTTVTGPQEGSKSVEERHDQAHANALAHANANANANAAASASESSKKTQSSEVAASASNASSSKRVDHLGIEG